MVRLYVDDIIIVSSDDNYTETFIKLLNKNFDIRDLGMRKHCISPEVEVKDIQISISQPRYINNIIKKYGLENCKPARFTHATRFKDRKGAKIPKEAEKVDLKA